MTLVEFFQKDAIENICSSLMCEPERIILVGDNGKLMKRHAECYKTVLEARGVDARFECITVNKGDIEAITEALEKIILQYGDCVFDLTGGDELYLVATGIILKRYREKNIQMHRINIRNNGIIDVDGDGETVKAERSPELSVRENIRIYGGDIVYGGINSNKTFDWNTTPDFKRDINKMWNICRRDVRLWNTQIGVFNSLETAAGVTDALTVTFPVKQIITEAVQAGGKYEMICGLIEELFRAELLEDVWVSEKNLSVTYKNEQVKRCLTVAGLALEMKVFLAALEATEKDGTRVYGDVMNGVFIDWDGDLQTKNYGCDTENEIDVMMMHGMVPVFVSCKNGKIDINELYKLDTVATRFGGKYAKKVLVAPALAGSKAANSVRRRAEDMGIKIVEGCSRGDAKIPFADMNDDDFNRVIRNLWRT